MLNSKQKKFLRSEAHSLKPIFQVGKDGVGEKIEEMFREMLAGPGAVRATIHKYVG